MTGLDLADLRWADAADVYKAGRLAGRLVRDGTGTAFTYDEAYLAGDGPPVAWTLPKTPEPAVASAGAVPAFFAGLLPEGARLQAIATGTHTSLDDHLTLLLAVGADTVGDVAVVPAGVSPAEPPVAFAEADAADADFVDVFARATGTSPEDFERVALPGVQVKVSAAMISTPVRTGTGPAILKLNPPTGFPRLVENEAFFLRMAAACGLPVPDHRLVHDRHGHRGLLAARFDRVTGAEGVRRLSQEDACQLAGEYPAAKYRLTTEQVAATIAQTVRAGDGSRPLALRRVFEVVAFSYLVGNGDLHAKNLSVRCSPAGMWEVTPAYDLLTTQPYTGWRDPMALDLYGRANRLTRSHLMEAAQRLGLPGKALTAVLEQITDAAPEWIDQLDDIGWDVTVTERLADLIRSRLTELTTG